MKHCLFITLLVCLMAPIYADISLYWWKPEFGDNFGDVLSPQIVQRITKQKVNRCLCGKKRLLAIGSILQFADTGDVIWGSGIGGNDLNREFKFSSLDARAVRGPLTRQFLLDRGIDCPEIYGDPALLLPILFPEFKRPANPSKDYIIIPHIGQIAEFIGKPNVVLPTQNWKDIIHEILDSKLVISGALHGIVAAEAFGIPARFLKLNPGVRSFKYEDYYLGTGRPNFQYATSVNKALQMGGEVQPVIDTKALLDSFPYDLAE